MKDWLNYFESNLMLLKVGSALKVMEEQYMNDSNNFNILQ